MHRVILRFNAELAIAMHYISSLILGSSCDDRMFAVYQFLARDSRNRVLLNLEN